MNLEDLYSILISEEINVANDLAKEGIINQPYTAFYSNKGKKHFYD